MIETKHGELLHNGNMWDGMEWAGVVQGEVKGGAACHLPINSLIFF